MAEYVLETGFQKKTLEEIKVDYESDFQTYFGNDIDLEPDGPFGQIIGILSQRDANLWDALQEIYTSRDPDFAIGTSLTAISRESGTDRNGATATTVPSVILYGTDGTVVVAGKKVKRSTDKSTDPILFSLDNDVEISITNTKELYLSIQGGVSDTEIFSVTIESIVYSYTASSGDDEDTVIDDLVSQIDPLDDFAAQNINSQLYIFSVNISSNISFTSNFTLELLGSSGNFTSDETGEISVPANTLTEIVTPVSGWTGVNNTIAGEIGAEEESDTALRIRRIQELSTGLSTVAAIRTEVSNVENVSDVNVETNRTNVTDIDGRPPHSFEVIVSGGDDDNIAQAIFDSAPAGIQWYGIGSSGTALDQDGVEYTVDFSRPTSVYIWVRVSRGFNTEESYPTNGDEEIKESVVSWSNENIGLGTDIIRQRLGIPIYEVTGVGDIVIEIAETDSPLGTPVYVEDNIVLAGRDKAEFDTTRITIQDLP